MSEGNFQEYVGIKTGDLVTYRSIKELSKQKFYKGITVYGIGIVTHFDDKYAKVYWTSAKQFLWVSVSKLTKIQSLDKSTPR